MTACRIRIWSLPHSDVTAGVVELVAGSLARRVEGRLIFLTTNHVHDLPPALLRLVDEQGQ